MKHSVIILSVATVMIGTTDCYGQLFGERTLGRSLNRRARQSVPSMEEAGTVTPDRRFVRGLRDRTDFVGGSDTGSFVGATQGRTEGTVTSSTSGLREEARRAINVPRGPQPVTGKYLARLAPAFEVSDRPVPSSRQEQLQNRLRVPDLSDAATSGKHSGRRFPNRTTATADRSQQRRLRVSIEVLVEGRAATLSGVAASEHDRQLAALLVAFEPGIDSVNNQVQVESGPTAADGSPRRDR
jgi:osmotically-inducible protein OsmY